MSRSLSKTLSGVSAVTAAPITISEPSLRKIEEICKILNISPGPGALDRIVESLHKLVKILQTIEGVEDYLLIDELVIGNESK